MRKLHWRFSVTMVKLLWGQIERNGEMNEMARSEWKQVEEARVAVEKLFALSEHLLIKYW